MRIEVVDIPAMSLYMRNEMIELYVKGSPIDH